jgi:hypothetical protein
VSTTSINPKQIFRLGPLGSELAPENWTGG